ncbi:MAG: ferrous iron efflux protein F [Bacteroidetes bacterium ADurb.Bin408]|nr:MAG: ferrous iron efflux protein F [Bacteroidetes bacterium ADurb.Bin408]
MGGLFSIYEGVHKITAHQGLRSPVIALIVLTVSMALEAASLLGCLKQIKKIRKEKKMWQWVRGSRKSELIVVLGEDIAALLGLFFAMLAVILSMITGNPVYDAMGSISIGVLLVIISFLLAFKVKSLLIGQSAEDDTREEIKRFLESRPEIAMIYNIITIQLGPDIMVSVKVKMTQTSSINQMIKDINNCEKELKKHFEAIRWVFFEPDNKE